MDDPQEFKSLDDLFRKTFENLPDEPAASGWDAPSPRVWEQVRPQIKTPKHGWTGKSILLISGFAIVLMLGLYWALTQNETTQDLPPATEQSETPEQTAEMPSDAFDLSDAATSENEEQPANNPAVRRNPVNSNARSGNQGVRPGNSTETEETADMQRRLSGSAPLPGTNHVSPNNTVRRQMEAWRVAPWAQPLAPLPSILESQFIRPVPESLKQIGN